MKKNFYDVNDAGKTFFWVVLMPQIFGMIIYITLLCVASSTGLDFQELLYETSQTYAFIMMAQIAFALVFVLYNKNINVKIACKISKISKENVFICIIIALVALIGLSPAANLFVIMLEQSGLELSTSLPFEINNFWTLLLAILSFALVPAIVEELIFRGAILQGLRKFGVWPAILGSAALFALIHASAVQLVFPLLYGIILAMVVVKSGSIISSMICHFTSNAASLLISYFSIGGTQEETLSVDGDFVIIATISVALVFFIVSALLKYMKNEDKYKNVGKNNLSSQTVDKIDKILRERDNSILVDFFNNSKTSESKADKIDNSESLKVSNEENQTEICQDLEINKDLETICNSQKNKQVDEDFEYRAFKFYNYTKKLKKTLVENNSTFWLRWGVGIGIFIWLLNFSTYFI